MKYHFDFSDKMAWVIRQGVKVYPIWKNKKAYIMVENNGIKKAYDKELIGKNEINVALVKTYNYLYEKLNPFKGV